MLPKTKSWLRFAKFISCIFESFLIKLTEKVFFFFGLFLFLFFAP